MDALPKKMAAGAVASRIDEVDSLYAGEEGDEEEESSTTNIADDAMIKVKSSTGKKGPGKPNTHTKKKTVSNKKKQ